jgi:hypothetical protein
MLEPLALVNKLALKHRKNNFDLGRQRTSSNTIFSEILGTTDDTLPTLALTEYGDHCYS